MQLSEELNISFFEKGYGARAIELDILLSQREAESSSASIVYNSQKHRQG